MGSGPGGYVFVGILGLLGGVAYLTNVVGLGRPGNLISGGTLPLLNAVVGLEVAAGFVLLAKEFLDQTAVVRPPDRDGPRLRRSWSGCWSSASTGWSAATT